MQYDWLLRGGSRAEAEARDTSFLRFYQMPARSSSRTPAKSPFLPSPFTAKGGSCDKRKLSRFQLKDKIKFFIQMLNDPSVERLPDKGDRLRRKKAEYEEQLQRLELDAQRQIQGAQRQQRQRQQLQHQLLKQAGSSGMPLGMLASEAVNIKETRAPGQQPRNRAQWRQPVAADSDDDVDEVDDDDDDAGDANEGDADLNKEQQHRGAALEHDGMGGMNQLGTDAERKPVQSGTVDATAVPASASQGEAGPKTLVASRTDVAMMLDSDAVLQLSDDALEELLVARMCGMRVDADTMASGTARQGTAAPDARHGPTHKEASTSGSSSEGSGDSMQDTCTGSCKTAGSHKRLQQQQQEQQRQQRGHGNRTPGLAVRERDVRWRPTQPPQPGQTRELSLAQLVRLKTRVEQERREARLEALMREDS